MRYRLILAALVVSATVGCSQDGAPTAPGSGAGELALLNALPAGASATLRLDGSALSLPAPGHAATTALSEGSHQLQAVSGGAVVASATFTMRDGAHRTALIGGTIATPMLLVTTLDTAAVAVTDAGKLRLVHTVVSAPALDAYVFEVGHAADSAARFLTNFSYGSGTDPRFPGYAVRPPGQYLVWLKAARTDDVVLQAGPFTLNAGDVYSLVLATNAGGALEVRSVKQE